MNRGFTIATLACATSIAFAGEPLKANPKFLWDSSTDTDARVVTGSPEKTSGYWYDFNDENDEGSSQIVFPASVEHGYINYYEPLIEYYGGITGTIKLDEGYEHPYVGFAFNIWDEEEHGANISEWGGFCLEYTSELEFYVEIGVENERTITGFNNFKVPIKSSSDTVLVEVPWAKFAQESGWGKQVNMDSVLAHAAIVRLKFEGEAGTKGHFLLKKMGSLGQCSGGSDAVKPVANSQVNVSVSGRMVNFEGVVPSAKVSVIDFQGHIVKSATAASTMNLNTLPAGIYMLRAQGSGVNHIQKIILK